MTFRRLEITDGTNIVSLIKGGFCLVDWTGQEPDVKGDGIWLDNPLLNGRELAIRQTANYIESFTLNICGDTQGQISLSYVALRRLLYKATQYFTNPTPDKPKVYLIAQGDWEDYCRYAQIMDYRAPNTITPMVGSMLSNPPVWSNFPLAIEHGDWYIGDPTTPGFAEGGVCAPIGNDQTTSYEVDHLLAETGGISTISVNLTTGELSTPFVYPIGNSNGAKFGLGIVFYDVPISPGDIIGPVAMRLSGSVAENTGSRVKIEGQLSASAAAFSTYADYIARPRTVAYKEWSFSDVVDTFGGVAVIPGLSDIIQEIVDQPGWALNNNFAMFIEDDGSAIGKFLGCWAGLTTMRVSLRSGDVIVLVADTCYSDEIYISNYNYPYAISQCYYYDASTAATTTLTGSPTPWQLLPGDPGVGDYVAFFNNALFGYEPSMPPSLVFSLKTPGVDISGVWEYQDDGGTWYTIDFVDYTNSFTNPGVNSIHLSGNTSDPAMITDQARWVRFRVTAIGSNPSPPIQWQNYVYCPHNAYFDVGIQNIPVTETSIDGTIYANPISGAIDTPSLTCDDLWICRRSLSRSADFSAYIPITDPNAYTLPDISVIFDPALFAPIGLNPQGSCLKVGDAGAMASEIVCQVGFQGSAASGYRGTYHAFVRRVYISDSELARYRLKICANSSTTGPFALISNWIQDTDNPEFDVLDFGVIQLPPSGMMDSAPEYWISIEVESTDAFETYLTELILMPIDEWYAHVWQRVDADSPTFIPGYAGNEIVIDDASRAPDIDVVYKPQYNSSGQLTFRTDDTNRFWLLGGAYTSACTGYRRQWHPAITFTVRAEYSGKTIGLAT